MGIAHRGFLEGGWGIQRPVAVKILSLPADVDPDEAMDHLARIVRRAVWIRHPALVEVLEVGRTEGIGGAPMQPFLVTELVEGESLASLVDGWRAEGVRVPVDFATVITLRVAEALGAALFTDGPDASLTNLVHGDLSPRQILLSSQGWVKVGDFGIAPFRMLTSSVRSHARLAYTAPEVANGSPPNAQADVFSLGVILHELLVGPRFGPSPTARDAMRMVRSGELYSSALEPNLPRGLREILTQATERHPMARYPHARAMAFDLRREMLRLGLCDAQTCIRHAIVGWYDTRSSSGERPRCQSSVELIVREEAPPPSGDTQPSLPVGLRR